MNAIRSLMLATMTLAPFAVGCTKSPVTGKPELIIISTQQEIAMGREAAPEFEKEFGGPVPDATLQRYVRDVGAKVAAVSHRPMPYEFMLLRSDVANAFALPGGKIYVTAGLVRLLQSERELAAVLGHEVGHVADRHNVKQLQKQLGVSVVAQLAAQVLGGDKGKVAEAATKVAGAMLLLSYSREDEYQADSIGIVYLERAGYNPWGMVELLNVLASMSEAEPGRLGEMLRTHPLPSKRIEDAQEKVGKEYGQYSQTQADPNRAAFLEMRNRLPAAQSNAGASGAAEQRG